MRKLKTLSFLLIIFFYLSGNCFSQTFKPNQISGLTLWLRADSNITHTTTVSDWDDCSGNSNNAIQATSGSQPLFITNALNGLPILRFDGGNDYFTFPDITLSKLSFFCVFKKAAGTIGVLLGGNTYETIQNYSDGTTYIVNAAGTNVGAPTGHITSYGILSIVYANPSSEFFVNGIPEGGTSNALTITFNSIGIRTAFPWYLNGEIAELILYNTNISGYERLLVENYLRLKYVRQINLGADINIPYGFKDTILNAHSDFTNYLWKGNSTDSTLSVNKSGTYWVQANDFFGYLSKDTINVTYPNTKLNCQNDTIICFESDLFLKSVITNKNKYDFLWSNGATDSVININTTGNYWVLITDSLGYSNYSDTIHISVDSLSLKVNLGNDTSFCSGNYIRIQPPLPNPENLFYTWSDASHDTTLVIAVSETYKVSVTNQLGCVGKDSVYVSITGTAPNTLFTADTACLGNPTQFSDLTEPQLTIIKWHWQFGGTDTSNLQNPTFTFATSGVHNVTLTTYNAGGCLMSYSKNVLVHTVPSAAYAVDAACINNPYQFIDLSSVILGDTIANWDWNFGDASPHSNLQNPVHTYTNANDYNVTLTIQTNNGCTNSVSHIIHVDSVSTIPSVPVIVYPLNNGIISDTNISFSWLPSLNTVRYKIIIASDINFNTVIADSIIDTTYFYKIFSSTNQIIFWKVHAYNICSDSAETQTHTVEIFTPMGVNACKLWLKADVGTSLVSGHVSAWADQSGSANNSLQTIADNRPLFVSNAINGLPVLRFDGTNDFMDFPDIALSKLSFFCVFKKTVGTIGVLFGGTTYETIQNYSDGYSWIVNSSGTNVSAPTGHITSYGILSIVYANPGSEFFLNGDPKGGSSNALTVTFNKIGLRTAFPWYLNGEIAEIILFDTVLVDTNRLKIEHYLSYKYAGPPVNLGPDININYGMCGTTLDAGGRFTNYHWSTSDTTQAINITQSGQYSVTATNIFGKLSLDTINVTFPNFIVHDTVFCLGDTLLLSANMGSGYSYLWLPDSITTSSLAISLPGNYSLTVYDTIGCPPRILPFVVAVDSFAIHATLGPDRTACRGEILGLATGGQQTTAYLWSNGSGDPQILISDAPGTFADYAVTVSNINGCSTSDTINVYIRGDVPTVDFVFDSVCPGQATHFSDLSGAIPPALPAGWLWTFGDGDSSSLQNPQHTYNGSGIYNVTLFVTTDSGCSKSLSLPVLVWGKPNVHFTPTNGCEDVPVPFTDNSTNQLGSNASWFWDFGLPGTNDTSTQQNPYFIYDTAGTFKVLLLVESAAGCSDTLSRMIEIKESLNTGFTYTQGCEGQQIFFVDTTNAPPWAYIMSWEWVFGDGDTSWLTSPSHIYGNPGIYDVFMTVRSLNGCINTAHQSINVYPFPSAGIGNVILCQGLPTQFTDISTVSGDTISHWIWTFGNQGTSTDQNPMYTPIDTSILNVILVVETDHACADSTTLSFNVNLPPHAAFTFYPEFGTAPLDVNFNNTSTGDAVWFWKFGDGLTDNVENPNHIYNTEGIFTATLITYSEYGCSDSTSGKVYVLQLVSDVEVLDLSSSITDNYLSFDANIINNGTYPVNALDLNAHFNGSNSISEHWSGILAPGQVLHYTFTSRFEIPTGTTVDYACVRAAITGITDEIPSNNEQCDVLNEAFVVTDPYPNPTDGKLNIDIILPFSDELQVDMYADNGKKVATLFSGMANSGFTSIVYDASLLEADVYNIQLNFRGNEQVRKFVKY